MMILILNAGAVANIVPVTNTKVICIENASKFQKPPYHASTTPIGEVFVNTIDAAITTNVNITAKINGSGKYFSTNFTEPLVNLSNKFFIVFCVFE